jgi:hypothetical protein
MGASGGDEMKIETDHVFKPGEIGKVCTFKKVYVDVAGTIPAKVGDTVARIDWDDGTPSDIGWHPDNPPILCEDEKLGKFLEFKGAAP